jgi:hypothetical protein
MSQTDEVKDFAHTGPGTLAGRFLRRFWHPIQVSDALAVGRPLRVQVLGEFFTLWRGEGGAVSLVQDRCPHRQTLLSLGRATISAASIMAGSSTAAANAWRSRPRRRASPPRSASAPIRCATISA